jgi:hypothetical protein
MVGCHDTFGGCFQASMIHLHVPFDCVPYPAFALHRQNRNRFQSRRSIHMG